MANQREEKGEVVSGGEQEHNGSDKKVGVNRSRHSRISRSSNSGKSNNNDCSKISVNVNVSNNVKHSKKL